MLQTLIVIICIVLAVGYACRRVYLLVARRRDPCYGCSGCALKQQVRHKKQVCDKKTGEKFGHSK